MASTAASASFAALSSVTNLKAESTPLSGRPADQHLELRLPAISPITSANLVLVLRHEGRIELVGLGQELFDHLRAVLVDGLLQGVRITVEVGRRWT